MNMLQIQDALKNASDQQLAMEMQNPTGMAPQFLVLSELKRRRDMRSSAQAQQAPQGTVADDLLQQNDGGIRDIVAPDEPEAQEEEMAGGGLVGLRRMREGGVVRMQAGGLLTGIPRPMLQAMLDGGMPIPQGMTRLDVMNALAGRQASMETTGPGGVGVAEPPSSVGGSTIGDIAGAAPGFFSSIGPISRPSEARVPVPRNPGRAALGALPPLSEIEEQSAEGERDQRVTDVLRGQERAALSAERSSDNAVRARETAIRDIRTRISGGTNPEEAIRSAVPGYRGVTEAEMRQAFGLPPLTDAPNRTAEGSGEVRPPPAPVPGLDPNYGEGVNFNPRGQGRAASNPSGTAPGRVTGLPGATVASRTGAAAGSPPAAPQEPAQAASLSRTDDRLQQIYDRLERDRVDPSARRNDAINMGLIEAGLRIAGSQSPHLAAAISEGGVPALQGYTREMGQIRQDQRQDNRDQLQTLLAQNQQEYYRGRISLGEMEMRQRAILEREKMANDRQIAGMRAAAGSEGRVTPAQYLAADENTRALYDRFLGRDSADLRAAGTTYTVLQNRERRVRDSIDSGLLSPADLATRRAELAEIQRQMQAVESRLMGGGGGTLAPREGGGFVYQPGGR